jgi:DNA-binding transcriptional ArsR family regulator
MEAQKEFLQLATLIGEPARAGMMWNLLDGRAYTATELSLNADISASAASNHLSKLLAAGLLKVVQQGRHRYYSFARPEVAYAVESLAALAANHPVKEKNIIEKNGIKYCRTCYDHLAGYVGVKMTEALERKSLLVKLGDQYTVTRKGWKWFSIFNISEGQFNAKRRPLARQCIDWSERKPHLAGQLGTMLMQKMLERKWFKAVPFSRELILTPKASRELYDLLGIVVH